MTKRALLTGVGQKYNETLGVLPALDLLKDLERIKERLMIKNWSSIEVVADIDFMATNVVTNDLKPVDKHAPSKENIMNCVGQILQNETDLLLIYYSGHGVLEGGKLYLMTYDDTYFRNPVASNLLDSSFFTESGYVDFTNSILENTPGLVLITILDCCFAGAVAAEFKQRKKFSNRHIIFCAVDAFHRARGPNKSASFFTNNINLAALATTTYNDLNKKITQSSLSFSSVIEIPPSLFNNPHPL